MASVSLIVMFSALFPVAHGIPSQGRALLQAHTESGPKLSKVKMESAQSAADGDGTPRKPSMRLIEHMAAAQKLDLNLIERALSGSGDTLDSEQAKVLHHALNLGSRSDPDGESEAGPGGMAAWIKTQLLPQAEQTKDEMQGEIERAVKAVDECKKLNWHAEKAVEHRQKLLASDEEEKYKCLAEEHQLHLTSESNCRDVDNFVKQLSAPSKLADTDHTDRDGVKTVLRENFNFFNNAYDQFKDLYEGCQAAMATAETTDKQCNADAEVVAEFYCHMKSGNDKACSEFHDCFESKNAILERVVKHVKVLEAENVNHFKKLACSAWNSESIENEVHPDCAETVNTAHLEVEYPEDIVADDCIGLAKTKQDYTGIKCLADGSVDHSSDATEEDSDGSESSEDAEGAEDAAADSDSESSEGASENATDAAPSGNATASAEPASGNATA